MGRRSALVGVLVILLAVILGAAFLLTRSAEQTPAAAPQGEPGPSSSFEMFDGSTATLADYRGRPVVVNFWASWCPPCVAEMPEFERVHQELGDQVAFLGINTQDVPPAGSPEAALRLVEQTGVSYDLAWDPDGELFQAFGVFGMPSTFFVSPGGEIVGRHTGLLTADLLRREIERLLVPA
ncbi:MAG: TlpA family protein disulfide reductase [Actinomycetota bacterium]